MALPLDKFNDVDKINMQHRGQLNKQFVLQEYPNISYGTTDLSFSMKNIKYQINPISIQLKPSTP